MFEHTQLLWPLLSKRRLFLTGGTGFFGHWLLETLLWANDTLSLDARVTILTRNPTAFVKRSPHLALDPAVTLLEGDVCTFAFPREPFTHVIHAATDTRASAYDRSPLDMLDTIIRGAQRVLEFARSQDHCSLLLTSSGAVYGRQPPDLAQVPEEYAGGPDPCDPRCVYAEGKRVTELYASLHASVHGLDVRVARCFAFVGPHLPLDEHFAAGNFIRDGLAGGPVVVAGDGTPYRSYLYAADLAIWLWTILLQGGPGGVFNVGSDEAVSIRELADVVAAHFGVPVQVARQPVPGAPVERYVPSVERAARQLGLLPRIRLEEAIRRTVRWHSGSG